MLPTLPTDRTRSTTSTSTRSRRQRNSRRRGARLQLESLENRLLLAVAAGDDTGALFADQTLTSANDYPPKVLADAPVGYWRFDEAAGTTADDAVGSLDGTISGGVTLGQAGPLASTSTAFVLNGANGKIDVPYNAALNPAGSFSVEGWARVDGGAGGFRSFVTSRDDIGAGADTRGFILYAANTNTWQFWTGTGGAVGRPGPWDVLTGPAIVNGQWTHIGMSFEVTDPPDANGVYRGIKSLYIDGQLVAQAANAFYEPNQVEGLHIGAGADTGNSFFFNGAIDEIAVYDRALTASEMQAHASAGLLGNDQDTDPNDLLTVVAIDGDPTPVGNTYSAPSGALATINADGTFTYDPNGAFNALSAGQTDTDTIRYTVSDTPGPLNNGLVGHWALNGDASNSAGDDHQGTVVGAPTTITGQIDEAFDFPGALDNRVDIPYSPALNPANFTVSAWAMVEGGQGGYRSLFTSRDDIAGDQRGFIVYAANTNTWQFWTGRGSGGGGWDNLTGPAVVLNQWTHVAITFEATAGPNPGGDYLGTKTLYIDGAPVASQTGSYEPNQVEGLHIGAGSDTGNSFFFNGPIDDVGLWNRALTAAEIAQIHGDGLVGDDLPQLDSADLVLTITGVGAGSVINEAPTATDNRTQLLEHGPTTASGNLITDDDGFGVDSDPDLSPPALVTPASVTLDVGSQFFPVGNLVDNSGLSGAADIDNYASVTHAGSSGTNAWTTDAFFPDYYAGGGPVPVMTFDLGQTVVLSDAVFWNYSVPGNATRTVTVEFSTDGPSGPFSNPVTVEVPQAAGPAHTVSLGGSFDADAVRLTLDDNWRGVGAGGDRVGLGEVKFIGATRDGLRIADINMQNDAASDVSGLYGNLDWEPDGSYTYSLDTNNPVVQTLAGGSVLTDTFTYTLTDQSPIDDGLVLHLPLNESSGATTAIDLSGNQLNGTVAGATAGQVGQIGSAYDFDSAAQTVELGSPAPLNSLTNNLTVSAWINPDNLGGIQRFFSINPGGGWGFGANGTNLRFTTYGVKDYDLTLPAPLLNNVWTHVAAVMDGNNDVEFFVNGSSVGTITHTAAGNPGTGQWYLGGRGPGGERFDGQIDDVAVWNRPLSAAELASVHASGVSGTSFQETDQATLTVSIVGINDAPIATDNSAEVDADGPLTDSGNLLTDDDGAGIDRDTEVSKRSLLTPSSVTLDASSQFYGVGNLVNSSGLSAAADINNYASITHAGSGPANAWVTDGFFPDYYAGGGAIPVMTFDLGGATTLTDAVFWNYSIPGNATRTITLEFSTSGTAGPFGNPVTVEVPQAAGPAHSVSLGGSFDANAVRFTFDDNWRGFGPGGDRVGLAEVKFIGTVNDSIVLTDVEDQTDPGLPVLGQYGELTWNRDGSYTYQLDSNNPDVQALIVPATLTDTFTYTIADQNAVTPSLVLHLPLDETAGATTALDLSGNGLHGTVNGAISDQSGVADSAYAFNGSTDNVDLGSPAQLNALTNNLTVAAWIHPDNLGGIQRFFSINPGGGWGFGANGTNLRFTTFGVRDYDLALPATLQNNVWTHVAAVMDSSNTVTFYVNGESVGSLAHGSSGNAGSGNWYLGGRGPGGEYFAGQLDDVAVWSRALSADDIEGVYASGLAGNSFQETADAQLEVTIQGTEPPITAEDDTVTLSEDGGPGPVDVTAMLLANDTPDTRIQSVDSTSTTGIVSVDNAGTVIYDPNGQFESLPAGATATDSFSYTLVSDFAPGSDTALVTVVIEGANDAPVVNAGGPYTIDEGQGLSLAGMFSDVDSGDTHTTGWDLNGDGIFNDAGINQSLTWAQLVALGIDDGAAPGVPTTITLRVDDGTAVVDQSTTLTVNNVAPTLTLSGPSNGVVGAPIGFNVTTSDPSPADVLAGFSYQVNWGDGQTETLTGGTSETLSHSFTNTGQFTVQLTVFDQDGDSGTATATIEIESVGIVDGDLYVGGTDDVNDRIIIQSAGRERVFVRLNDQRFGPYDILASATVFVFGGGGQDRISVTSCLNTEIHGGEGNDEIAGGPCRDVIYGGPGRDLILTGEGDNWAQGDSGGDTLIGRSGNDVLLGGEGNDRLIGSSGNDTLSGEGGNDSLVGGSGDDLLIGGDGNDLIYGQNGNDVALGGDGNDQIRGGENDDLLVGGFGRDAIQGERGNDVVLGGYAQYEDNDLALLILMLEWTQDRNSQALGMFQDDGEVDGLNGGGGPDELHVGQGDNLVLASNDQVFQL